MNGRPEYKITEDGEIVRVEILFSKEDMDILGGTLKEECRHHFGRDNNLINRVLEKVSTRVADTIYEENIDKILEELNTRKLANMVIQKVSNKVLNQ